MSSFDRPKIHPRDENDTSPPVSRPSKDHATAPPLGSFSPRKKLLRSESDNNSTMEGLERNPPFCRQVPGLRCPCSARQADILSHHLPHQLYASPRIGQMENGHSAQVDPPNVWNPNRDLQIPQGMRTTGPSLEQFDALMRDHAAAINSYPGNTNPEAVRLNQEFNKLADAVHIWLLELNRQNVEITRLHQQIEYLAALPQQVHDLILQVNQLQSRALQPASRVQQPKQLVPESDSLPVKVTDLEANDEVLSPEHKIEDDSQSKPLVKLSTKLLKKRSQPTEMDGRRKKRPIHNLKGQLVSAKVRLPQGVPMKDVEILVYCFNHITHPLVALRIMDNGWRPSEICEILNSHRDIEPPYLANTVTNKLKAVMARGKALYGENWPPADRAPRVDQSIDDLRINDGKAQDCEIRAFAEGIKAHPYGHNAGLFTKCVKYCANNNDDTKVSEIHKIVEILNQLDNMSYEEKVEAGVVKKKREKGDVGGLGDDGKLDPELGLEE